MRKIAITAVYVLTVILLASCSAFGSNTSMPVIAVHSGADVSEENDSHFVELSKPFSNNSSESSYEESNTSVEEESSESDESSVNEESSKPGESSASEESSEPDDPSVNEESSESGESSVNEESSEPDDPSVNEESSEPDDPSVNEESSQPELMTYSYNGFEIKGFSEEQIEEITTQIKKIINKTHVNISVYYEDISTGFSFSYDGNRAYKAGSVTKAPYTKYLIESGVNLDEKLTLRNIDKKDGSGVLKNQPAGTEYTVKQLIEYAIINSDNTAFKMLYQRFGFDGFNKYCQDLGVSLRLGGGDVWGDLTAYDAGTFFRDIYTFEKEDDRSAFFMDSLRNTTYYYLIPSGVGTTPVAHKYGYMSAVYKVLHDVGIVYTERPYIAVIMTNFDGGGGNGRNTFTEISSCFKAFAESLKNN